MAHILFADATDSALLIMCRALDLGHRLTFLRSESWQMYQSALARHVQARARVLSLPVTSDAELVTEVVREVHAQDPIDAVVGPLDTAIEAIAIACDRLGLPFTSVQGVRNARNKADARRLLVRAGLASARHAWVRDADEATRAADQIGYPVVVKPVSGVDSMLATRADDEHQVRQAVQRILASTDQIPAQFREHFGRGILVEEHLVGELVSAELGVLGGQAWRFIICGRSRAVENECVEMGAALPADLPPARADECFAYAEQVCAALGLDLGVFHIELMLTQDGPVLVEANPRVMGGVMTSMYATLTGVDIADYVLSIHLRQPPASPAAVPGSTTITARKIMPQADGYLPAEIDLGWLDDPDSGLAGRYDYGLVPGAQVRAQQVLARYLVMGEGWTPTMQRANALVERFEKAIGLPVFHSAPVSRG